MALDLKVNNFKRLSHHVGHNIVCVMYGETNDTQALCNVAIECETCGEVLIDYDNPELEEPNTQPDIDPAYYCPICNSQGEPHDSDFGEEGGSRKFRCTNEKCEAAWEALYNVDFVQSEVYDEGNFNKED